MGRAAVVCSWARPFPGPEPEASPTRGARLGALLPTVSCLGSPMLSREPQRKGLDCFRPLLKPALPGLSCGWDRGSSWPQTSPCTPAPSLPEPQEAENLG